jgi:hypothetical protein
MSHPTLWIASPVCAIGFLWAAPAGLGWDWWNEGSVRRQMRGAAELGEQLDVDIAAAHKQQEIRRTAFEDLAGNRITPLEAGRLCLGTGQAPPGPGATPEERAAHHAIDSALCLVPPKDRESTRHRWEEQLHNELAAGTCE